MRFIHSDPFSFLHTSSPSELIPLIKPLIYISGPESGKTDDAPHHIIVWLVYHVPDVVDGINKWRASDRKRPHSSCVNHTRGHRRSHKSPSLTASRIRASRCAEDVAWRCRPSRVKPYITFKRLLLHTQAIDRVKSDAETMPDFDTGST